MSISTRMIMANIVGLLRCENREKAEIIGAKV